MRHKTVWCYLVMLGNLIVYPKKNCLTVWRKCCLIVWYSMMLNFHY